MSEQEEREQFEKWQKCSPHWVYNPKHPNGGRYADDKIEEQWIVWQAATESLTAQLRERERQLANLTDLNNKLAAINVTVVATKERELAAAREALRKIYFDKSGTIPEWAKRIVRPALGTTEKK